MISTLQISIFTKKNDIDFTVLDWISEYPHFLGCMNLGVPLKTRLIRLIEIYAQIMYLTNIQVTQNLFFCKYNRVCGRVCGRGRGRVFWIAYCKTSSLKIDRRNWLWILNLPGAGSEGTPRFCQGGTPRFIQGRYPEIQSGGVPRYSTRGVPRDSPTPKSGGAPRLILIPTLQISISKKKKWNQV